jgi:phosphohistidine phosphatase SixA
LGQFAARMLGAKTPLEFKKGAVCCIELDGLPPNGPGHLRWFVTPRMLRRVAG